MKAALDAAGKLVVTSVASGAVLLTEQAHTVCGGAACAPTSNYNGRRGGSIRFGSTADEGIYGLGEHR